MPLVAVWARILYVIWKRGRMEADFNILKEALHYKDESQLRRIVPRLSAQKLLVLEQRPGRPDTWVVTREGRLRIRFLTLPVAAYAILTAFGTAIILEGVMSWWFKLPVVPSGLVGIGAAVLIFALFLWLMGRSIEKEILSVKSRREPVEG